MSEGIHHAPRDVADGEGAVVLMPRTLVHRGRRGRHGCLRAEVRQAVLAGALPRGASRAPSCCGLPGRSSAGPGSCPAAWRAGLLSTAAMGLPELELEQGLS